MRRDSLLKLPGALDRPRKSASVAAASDGRTVTFESNKLDLEQTILEDEDFSSQQLSSAPETARDRNLAPDDEDITPARKVMTEKRRVSGFLQELTRPGQRRQTVIGTFNHKDIEKKITSDYERLISRQVKGYRA